MQLADLFEPLLADNLVEFQIDNKGIIERGWRVDDSKGIKLLESMLCQYAPVAIEDLTYPHDIITVHPADGITYLNETIVVSFTCAPNDYFRRKYGIPGNLKLAKDEFTVKYDTITGLAVAKVHDLNIESYWLPPVPKGFFLGRAYGVGRHFTDDSRAEIADFYFIHPDRELMREFFGPLYPEYTEDFIPTHRGYCMSVDQVERKILKIKRYIYMQDKELNHLDTI